LKANLILLRYGGGLIANREYDMLQFFICFMAVTFGAQSAGTLFSFAADMGKRVLDLAKAVYLDMGMLTLHNRQGEGGCAGIEDAI
jgi:hypothetical protein